MSPGTLYPTLLRIHGGPNGQDDWSFSFERELFAANGYVVLAVNYRGSSGRGSAFQKAIFADWGHKEVIDLLGAVDQAVAMKIADPARLGIGGWSYGGILTDYTIATDTRFKAAISGAGSALQLSMYGSDQYIRQYEQEIGVPWKATDAWIRISYPVLQGRPHQDADAVHGRRKGLQRPDRRRRADVPGPEEPGRRDRARRLSGAVPRSQHAELRPRQIRALSRLVRQVPEAGQELTRGRMERPSEHSDKRNLHAVNLALLANAGLAALKTAIGILGHSPALLADGINSTSDVAYGIIVKVFIRMARKPADDEHPYGHRQLESIAALIVGAFVLTTAVAIFWDAINRVYDLLSSGTAFGRGQRREPISRRCSPWV